MSLATDEERRAVAQIVESKAYLENPELLPWYTKDLEEPKPEVKDLFARYSHVPASDVVSHIKKVRDQAFNIVRNLVDNDPGQD